MCENSTMDAAFKKFIQVLLTGTMFLLSETILYLFYFFAHSSCCQKQFSICSTSLHTVLVVQKHFVFVLILCTQSFFSETILYLFYFSAHSSCCQKIFCICYTSLHTVLVVRNHFIFVLLFCTQSLFSETILYLFYFFAHSCCCQKIFCICFTSWRAFLAEIAPGDGTSALYRPLFSRIPLRIGCSVGFCIQQSGRNTVILDRQFAWSKWNMWVFVFYYITFIT
jgi:hypothetical protein